jgi:hypothetical protein
MGKLTINGNFSELCLFTRGYLFTCLIQSLDFLVARLLFIVVILYTNKNNAPVVEFSQKLMPGTIGMDSTTAFWFHGSKPAQATAALIRKCLAKSLGGVGMSAMGTYGKPMKSNGLFS